MPTYPFPFEFVIVFAVIFAAGIATSIGLRQYTDKNPAAGGPCVIHVPIPILTIRTIRGRHVPARTSTLPSSPDGVAEPSVQPLTAGVNHGHR